LACGGGCVHIFFYVPSSVTVTSLNNLLFAVPCLHPHTYRYYFLPFIDLLEKHCVVHDMGSSIDYRRKMSLDFPSYYFATNDITDQQLHDLITDWRDGAVGTPQTFALGQSRSLALSNADIAGRVVVLSVADLCAADVGATDFRRIAYHFQRVVLRDIPLLHNKPDVARRFITLVDELYEGRCAVACIASTPHVHELFPQATPTVEGAGDNQDSSIPIPALGLDQAKTAAGYPLGALASVRELDFAFLRAASRLTEMTSLPWWDKVLRPV
jgi:predicted ATPase